MNSPFPNFQNLPPENAEEFALSIGQQAIWSIYKMAPGSRAYNIPCAMRIRMSLDIPALRRALQKLVDRHATLRTTFTLARGKPVQRIVQQQEVPLQCEDAATLSEMALKRRLAAESARPFDLESGPLLRTLLFTRSNEEHILLLVTHYIAADFQSLVTLIHELGLLYEAERSGVPAPLPPLELAYTDYVRWHTDLMAGPQGRQLLGYWQEQLPGAPPILNLPTDLPRPPIQTYRGSSQTCVLDAALTSGLKRFSQEHGVSLYTTLLAAFQVLLHRYTGQEQVWIGSPLPGRSQTGFADMVGYLANSVVLRADLAGNPTFTRFLAQAQQTVQAAREHQDYPFATLVEKLHPGRDFSHSPLFQVFFDFQQAYLSDKQDLAALILGVEGVELKVGGLRLASMALEEQTAQFDLTLMVGEVKDELVTLWRYSTDLFEKATLIRLLEQWKTLLQSILADPDRPVAQLNLLPEAERQKILVAWNDTGRDYEHGKCIHEWFEAQAARAPEAIAVIGRAHPSGGEIGPVTYQTLNSRANQLARHLQSLGVRTGDRVGICMERCADMLTGIFGILKAGAAYVPLDPKYPQERIRFVLQDTQASVLLTQSSLRDEFSTLGAHLVCLDADWASLAQQSAENLVCQASADDPAYVIYTSGSTGEPKGVMLTHASLWPHVQALQVVMGLTEQDRHLHSQSFTFSASVRQFMAPLCAGAAVVIATTEQVHDPLALFKLMKDHAVTIWGVTPSYWRNCIDVLRGAAPEKRKALLENKLRMIVSSGEVMHSDIVQAWRQDLGHAAQPVNMFGMTETTGVVTACPVPLEQDETLHNISVGRPISNARIYLLDRHLEPVSIGLPGEVYIGGPYPARGYHNRPALTAERFIPDPFSLEPGARLYKTGDLARFQPDGALDFIERADYQIKIRGYRIEPGEVETALVQYPTVREAVVLGQETSRGQAHEDKELVAYVVADPLTRPTQGELREFAKDRLPDYMVPAAFVFLDSLPLTATGKVDRKALLQMKADRPGMNEGYAPPRNPVEEVLTRMWTDLLHVDRVGIYDNFFELGGHSLLAVQAMGYLQEMLRMEEPLIAFFFENPTVAGVTDALLQSEAGQGDMEEIAATLNLIAGLSDEEVDAMLASMDDDAAMSSTD
ncbi:MAG: amino acid adenylation domain-containing protein [Anaerolineales bacterium]